MSGDKIMQKPWQGGETQEKSSHILPKAFVCGTLFKTPKLSKLCNFISKFLKPWEKCYIPQFKKE